MTDPELLASLVEVGDCWIWTGRRHSDGYGLLSVGGRQTAYAHRFVWELLVGSIPAGFQIDHLCRVHACVNPDHLEPVPPRVNMLRGVHRSARLARSGACMRGHPRTPENNRITRDGRRQCVPCIRVRYDPAKRRARTAVETEARRPRDIITESELRLLDGNR